MATSATAPSARLVYVDDAGPGIRRRRCGRGYAYQQPDGRRLRDAKALQRIAALAIPPACTQVWICPVPHGHLQATGRDSRGRKQYRYHADWQRTREADKFARLGEFGAALPKIRRRIARDLRGPWSDAPQRRVVLAAIVRLLDTTLVRVGNEAYARSNGSYGLTTLRNRHAAVRGARLRLRFPGKSGVPHDVDLKDPQLARLVRRCQSLPGQELFQYADADGALHPVTSTEVNDYLREAAAMEVTAKDFRTWHASVLALALQRAQPELRPLDVLREVAKSLRNTVAVCRKSYVHPAVWVAPDAAAALRPRRGLSVDECAMLALLSGGRVSR